MFFPFSSFFFAEEFVWDAMTVPAKKSRPGRGLGRCGARRGSAATDAGPGARLLRRVLARTGGPTHAARRPGSPPSTLTGCDLSRTSWTESPISSLSRNSTTTRRLNLKKEPSCQANSSAGAQSTMGRDVVAGSPPSGRGPRESGNPVRPRAPGTRSPGREIPVSPSSLV